MSRKLGARTTEEVTRLREQLPHSPEVTAKGVILVMLPKVMASLQMIAMTSSAYHAYAVILVIGG